MDGRYAAWSGERSSRGSRQRYRCYFREPECDELTLKASFFGESPEGYRSLNGTLEVGVPGRKCCKIGETVKSCEKRWRDKSRKVWMNGNMKAGGCGH